MRSTLAAEIRSAATEESAARESDAFEQGVLYPPPDSNQSAPFGARQYSRKIRCEN